MIRKRKRRYEKKCKGRKKKRMKGGREKSEGDSSKRRER